MNTGWIFSLLLIECVCVSVSMSVCACVRAFTCTWERERERERERCSGFNNKVILLASQYLEVMSSIKFNYSQFNKWFSLISSSLEQSRQFGEGSIPILWRCLLKQSWPVISLNIATADFLGTSGIMPGVFKNVIHFESLFISIKL